MQSGDGRDPGLRSTLQGDPASMLARLRQREDAVAELEAIVEKQQGLLERYDAVMRDMGPRGRSSGGDGPLAAALDRSLALLEQAVASAESRARQVADLEAQLDRTLGLLDQSLRNQEQVAGRGNGVKMPAASMLDIGDVPAAVEETLAKYDQMLERSLAALEAAYNNGQSSRKELEERDRLLNRTLDLLQNTVEAEGGGRRPGFMSRLFT
ncbi:MAG: hypothetical protein AB7I79_21895 [Rhizobiaceae bacterium]